MNTFEQRAQAFLQQAEKQYPAPFCIEHDYVCCDRQFPMMAGYESRDPRYLFGIKSSLAQDTLCGEKCFFDCCESLDEQKLAQYTELFRNLQDTCVPCTDPTHEFTLISFVLCTDHVDKSIEKKIKRIRDSRRYKKEKYGWSELRLCVVDVSEQKYYCNRMGKAVVECLTRERV